MAKAKLIDLGGGWFERPDGEKVQLRKEDVKEYEKGLARAEPAVGSESVARGKAASTTTLTPALGGAGFTESHTSSAEDYQIQVKLQNTPDLPPPPVPPPAFVMPEGIDDGSGEPDLTPKAVPGSTFPIGPFTDYAFVNTPWGEFGVPKGKYITGIKEVRDPTNPEKISYIAEYGGKFWARNDEERERWLRLTEQERRAEQAQAAGR